MRRKLARQRSSRRNSLRSAFRQRFEQLEPRWLLTTYQVPGYDPNDYICLTCCCDGTLMAVSVSPQTAAGMTQVSLGNNLYLVNNTVNAPHPMFWGKWQLPDGNGEIPNYLRLTVTGDDTQSTASFNSSFYYTLRDEL